MHATGHALPVYIPELGRTVPNALHDLDPLFAEAAPSPEASDLLEEWLNLVHEKNALVRYESELMVQYVCFQHFIL